MKIILKKKHEILGEVGDVVSVKSGFARNFLIPNGIAMVATHGNLKVVEKEKKNYEIAERRAVSDAEQLKEKLETTSVTAELQVGEEEKVFGAITSHNIADLLAEKGFEIDRRKILLDEPIKALGVYEVGIRLHADVEAKVKVWAVKQ
ncbi:MAG: 50S ribosomal protein L9 [Deferribacteres bacterium]|nr:50S ribosomal protein L9 [candidate division KSB1 bacterium]MCB9502507.1 50S ribosomal protein L9 [Deferribacteres bacterium]